MSNQTELLKCFGAGASNGHRISRFRSRAGLDEAELNRVLMEAADAGPLSPVNQARAAAYAAGFRCGWLAGWGT